MGAIPSVQLNIQNAKIGFQTTPGSWDIRQPSGELEMHTTPLKIEMRSPGGELSIDQSEAWDALGQGSHTTWLNRIYTESKNIVLQGIARIVENGNRMAQIQNNIDPIPEMAAEQAFEPIAINYLGETSYNNVHIDYRPRPVEYNVTPASLDIRYTPRLPTTQYTPGKFEIYNIQYPKVDIIPPQIDLKL
jgi:hypothetical protein